MMSENSKGLTDFGGKFCRKAEGRFNGIIGQAPTGVIVAGKLESGSDNGYLQPD
jgi:hypothetical protein